MVYACFFVLLMMFIIVDPVVAQDHRQIDAPDFVKLINWRRRQFAKTFRFPNMYEVIAKRPYDDHKEIGDNYRSYSVHPGLLGGSWHLRDGIEKFWDKKKTGKWVSTMDANKLESIEFFVPEQTRIGCAPHRVVKYNKEDSWLLCLLGPETSLDSMRVKADNDGTMCKQGHIDGLCQWSGRESREHEHEDSAVAGSEKINFLLLMVLQCMIIFFSVL